MEDQPLVYYLPAILLFGGGGDGQYCCWVHETCRASQLEFVLFLFPLPFFMFPFVKVYASQTSRAVSMQPSHEPMMQQCT